MTRTLSKQELATLGTLTLLFVDDDEGIRNGVSRFLKRRFRNYYEAPNGREGFALYQQYRPDVIVTDVTMPVMDGLEMARRIKADDESMPIIVNSAHNEMDFFAEAIEIGVDAYILKPTDLHALLFLILKSVQPLLKQRALENQNRLIQHLVELSASPTLIANGDRPECANRALLDLLGCSSPEQLLAQFEDATTSAAIREAQQLDCLDQARTSADIMSRVLQRSGKPPGAYEVARFDLPELERSVFCLKPTVN